MPALNSNNLFQHNDNVTLAKTYAFSKVNVKQRLNIKGKKGIDGLILSGPEVLIPTSLNPEKFPTWYFS